MKTIRFLLLSLFGAWIFTGCASNAEEASFPNILLITADDMNWNSVGVYSSTLAETTPNIDRLAGEGYRFDYANGIYAANLRELYNDSLNVHNIEWKNQAALEFIDQAGDEPFFLYYSEMVPHGPALWIRRNGEYVFGLDANPGFTGEGG